MTQGQRPKFLDRDHPFFARSWVRVVSVVIPAGMALLELANDSPGWALLFAAAAGWALWELFLRK